MIQLDAKQRTFKIFLVFLRTSMKEGKAMKETGIILVILGAMCTLAAGAEWVAEHVPDWLWEPLRQRMSAYPFLRKNRARGIMWM